MSGTTPQGDAPGGGATAQERLDWLKRTTAVWVIALLVMALAAVGALFAFGVFTAATPHQVTFGTGTIGITHSHVGTFLDKVDGLVPGDSRPETVRVIKTDDSAGEVMFDATQTAESPTGAGEALSQVLHLKVEETDGPNSSGSEPAIIYNGPLSGILGTENGKPLPPRWVDRSDSVREYEITISFPANQPGVNYNVLKNKSVTVQFRWTVTAVPSA